MNRLSGESSPYLRQHADNPVDWYPWGEEAFAAARERDVPVLVSIGYSACHWCHVMAHESFEDEAVAAVMNRLFVNVKVDREERPDVDAVYMEATQAMTGSGGWPMTVFVLPDGRPFFAGTYFPKEPHGQRPGFVQILEAVHDAWRDRRDDLTGQAADLTEAVRARSTIAGSDDGTAGLGPGLLRGGYEVLRQAFDAEWGGFGRAPKFPQPSQLELVLRSHAHNRSAATLEMITTTLDAMASGGIYDHLGGGFARYSVDAFWMVPHFEKMLSDQAQLVRAYLHGFQVTANPVYRQVVEETVGYVLRDLRSPDGGLYSAEDADSEGEEGRFYVWRPEQLAAVLDADGLTDAATAWYGVTKSGNFEGANILHRPVRGDLLRPPEIERARELLFAARTERVRPGLDDKVLTEWNAMFVAALAEAGGALGRDDWLGAATTTAEFLLAHSRIPGSGRWLRSWQREAGGRHLAYAGDHAWLVDAFTRLAEATGQARWIAEATAVADALIAGFWDDADGGFFTTGDDAERLVVRQKEYADGANPSANAVAALALLRLAALTGDARYGEHGERVLGWLAGPMGHHPQVFPAALGAVDLVVSGTTEVVVPGSERTDLVAAVQRRFLPTAVLAWGEPYDSPLWADRHPGAAYVCHDHVCLAPVTDEAALLAALDAPRPG